MSFYAVAKGRTNGIFLSWKDCSQSVKGYKNAKYKKFSTKEEAEEFISQTCITQNLDNHHYVEHQLTCRPNYFVYTDGSCIHNGKSNARAGIGIFFDMDDPRNISKKIEGKQTNNVAELMALIDAYSIVKHDVVNGKNIAIVSDSEYAIKCATHYGAKCSKQDWMVDIPNKELVKKAYETYKNVKNIQLIHIRAHTNNTDIHSRGNDFADKLANQALG